ncbi:hypothetical protein HZH66_000554 [Vespula vulgaris]|uniref:Uncharacterized protein n=1 Tax=Vespula vulgaris TaxID=7454 RepID=A0A834KRH5_VESVU|nr:hypothetical protein HZH66_000554 [Vespula vulgaris]
MISIHVSIAAIAIADAGASVGAALIDAKKKRRTQRTRTLATLFPQTQECFQRVSQAFQIEEASREDGDPSFTFSRC